MPSPSNNTRGESFKEGVSFSKDVEDGGENSRGYYSRHEKGVNNRQLNKSFGNDGVSKYDKYDYNHDSGKYYKDKERAGDKDSRKEKDHKDKDKNKERERSREKEISREVYCSKNKESKHKDKS